MFPDIRVPDDGSIEPKHVGDTVTENNKIWVYNLI